MEQVSIKPPLGMRMFPTILNIAKTAKSGQGRIFDSMTLKIQAAKTLYEASLNGVFDGSARTAPYMARCAAYHEGSGAQLVYTRDTVGRQLPYMNWHLAISFVSPLTLEEEGLDEDKERPWVEAFFGDHTDKVFREEAIYFIPNPKKVDRRVEKSTNLGKGFRRVAHYRLYLDGEMQAMEAPEDDTTDAPTIDETPSPLA